jgi:hypothetical protein
MACNVASHLTNPLSAVSAMSYHCHELTRSLHCAFAYRHSDWLLPAGPGVGGRPASAMRTRMTLYDLFHAATKHQPFLERGGRALPMPGCSHGRFPRRSTLILSIVSKVTRDRTHARMHIAQPLLRHPVARAGRKFRIFPPPCAVHCERDDPDPPRQNKI